MLDREDVNNLEFIGIGLITTELQTNRNWFSEKDLEYLNKIRETQSNGSKPEIKNGIVDNISIRSNGCNYVMWVKLKSNERVYVGSLSKYERLRIKEGSSINYRQFGDILVICNEQGDILTI
jgi:hypothetical protein